VWAARDFRCAGGIRKLSFERLGWGECTIRRMYPAAGEIDRATIQLIFARKLL
jgi:hypothetical protein